ncbi:MAG: N-6 DNA methylase [Anaerolineae bacterium]|nr:N-6 DNA methylase [Anaerolineae bacterium]
MKSGMNPLPLTESVAGTRIYQSADEIITAKDALAYQHLLLKAWRELQLTAVLSINGIPTVYVRDDIEPVEPQIIAELHRKFWNQGLATIFLLRDTNRIRVFSAMKTPIDPKTATEKNIENDLLVEAINNSTQAIQETLILKIATGQYYASKPEWFVTNQGIDSYLLRNLEAVRNELVDGKDGLSITIAHAFLGRILFVCYLCHRGIINLATYFPDKDYDRLQSLLSNHDALYNILFPKLKEEFNGSMFDNDLFEEGKKIKLHHLEVVQSFLNGDDVTRHQKTLGIWAYDFSFIPIELISSIYEKFLGAEDDGQQKNLGAYYTPRFLAEMTLDVALEGRENYDGLRFLDPACGSGIFLVLMFNRLVAEWRSKQQEEGLLIQQSQALRERLNLLRGVDKNPTACRITCFSLYVAYLDQFNPPDVRKHMEQTGEKLPALLYSDKPDTKNLSVVWEQDFFNVADEWQGQFDIIVGNPPWVGRGTKQIAQAFVEKTPALLSQTGKATLVVPSKILLNKTDKFQSKWLALVRLEKVVQLADYRFILFNEAKSPATIMRFINTPAQFNHNIEYVTPKVTPTDLRNGVISVSSQDRKWIRQTHVMQAAKQGIAGDTWKMYLWGTPRDQKLLAYLLTFPKLEDHIVLPSKNRNKELHQSFWLAGVGFKPTSKNASGKSDRELKPLGNWHLNDEFISHKDIRGLYFVPNQLTSTLGEHLTTTNSRLDALYSKPSDKIFAAPLIVWNGGFTDVSFFDRNVRFRDALHSISGPPQEESKLIFLTAFFRSKLARYFIFHTAASLGIERDQVHLHEALQLPFLLPEHEDALPNSQVLMDQIVAQLLKLKSEAERSADTVNKRISPLDPMNSGVLSGYQETPSQIYREWRASLVKKSQQVKAQLDPLIYQYFGLTSQDIALVEDTCNIFDKSATPSSLDSAKSIPTLKNVDAQGMQSYADMITQTLNEWTSGEVQISATGSKDNETGLGLLELRQTVNAEPYTISASPQNLARSMNKLQQISRQRTGILEYQHSGWYFDNNRIIIVKPARLGEWTQTAGLNDAAEIYAHISMARQS